MVAFVRRSQTARVILALVAAALALVLGGLWSAHDDGADSTADADPSPASTPGHRAAPGPSAAPRPAGEPRPSPRAPAARPDDPTAASASAGSVMPITADERARLRAAILAKAAPREPRPAPAGPPPAGQLRKRVEGHDALFAELNRDFMPLADECIEQALTRDEALAGTLAIGVELLVDDELGTIVEAVGFPADTNEVDDPELHTCVRESLLSMVLPADAETGRTAVMLTMPIASGD